MRSALVINPLTGGRFSTRDATMGLSGGPAGEETQERCHGRTFPPLHPGIMAPRVDGDTVIMGNICRRPQARRLSSEIAGTVDKAARATLRNETDSLR